MPRTNKNIVYSDTSICFKNATMIKLYKSSMSFNIKKLKQIQSNLNVKITKHSQSQYLKVGNTRNWNDQKFLKNCTKSRKKFPNKLSNTVMRGSKTKNYFKNWKRKEILLKNKDVSQKFIIM